MSGNLGLEQRRRALKDGRKATRGSEAETGVEWVSLREQVDGNDSRGSMSR